MSGPGFRGPTLQFAVDGRIASVHVVHTSKGAFAVSVDGNGHRLALPVAALSFLAEAVKRGLAEALASEGRTQEQQAQQLRSAH